MNICFVLEGNYPYVRGGVSTWVDGFIRAMPEHKFILWTIIDEEIKLGQFKYELPANVVAVHENALNSSLNLRIRRNPNLKFSQSEKIALSELLRCGTPDWKVLLDCFYLRPERSVEFLLSEEFLELLKDYAAEQFPYAGFKDLFWSVRSMFLPMLYLVGQPMPKADLYHSPSTGYAGVLAALASLKHDKPYLLTEHGIYTREREEEILRSDWVLPYFKEFWIAMFYMFSKYSYESADCVTSLYHRASLIQQDLGCAPEKCLVIRNGLHVDNFASIHPKTENGWIDIASITRFAPIKDIKTMIYTFSRLKQDISNVRLHILGGVDDEDYYQECLALIEYLDVPDIVIPGIVNVRTYLEDIDFTLLTSISEGQPYALLESLAAGRPVIATDVGNCREIIDGEFDDDFGPAGICVPPMHQARLLQALSELCSNNAKREEMARAGKERVKKFYNIEKMTGLYHKAYEKAVATWQASGLS